jgi:hypothetical protein
MNCSMCIHNRMCEYYRRAINVDMIKLMVKDADAYAMFMSSMRSALAENCQFYREQKT